MDLRGFGSQTGCCGEVFPPILPGTGQGREGVKEEGGEGVVNWTARPSEGANDPQMHPIVQKPEPPENRVFI